MSNIHEQQLKSEQVANYKRLVIGGATPLLVAKDKSFVYVSKAVYKKSSAKPEFHKYMGTAFKPENEKLAQSALKVQLRKPQNIQFLSGIIFTQAELD